MSESKQALSRRNFLKGSAVMAAGAAAIGLAGCSTNSGGGSGSSESSGSNWDKTADIIVVGTGTVVVAALAASDFGAESIIVLEKSKAFGGTSALSGGGVGIPLTHVATEAGVQDSKDEVLKYYRNASGGRADMDVVESYVENGDEFLTWSEEKCAFTWGFTGKMYQDYYEPVDGFLGFGRGNISVKTIDGKENAAYGGGVWAKYQKMVEDDDKIELLMETPAISLVTDDSGAVTGVVASASGKEMRIGANKAVILGTGGFEHDQEMRTKYLPYRLLSLTSVDTNTGDAQKMGMRIGADLANMDRNWGLPGFLLNGEDPVELMESNEAVQNFTGFDANTYRGLPGSVVVNSRGERIGNECAAYDVFNRAFGRFDTGLATMANIPSYYIVDSAFLAAYKLPGQAQTGDPVPESFESGETLEELAGKLGIDPVGLAVEMASFNENAILGVDPKWNRGGHEFDINTGGVYAGMRADLANPVLAPLSTPPYYGIQIVPGTFGTCGGLRTDANAQVLDVDGETIAGLYAVGNCSSGVSGGAYCHGGMTVGSGSVMSWVAVRHILGVTS